MSLEIKLDEADLASLLKRLSPEQHKRAMQQAILKGCIHLEGKVKRNTPVKTGRLRASWTHAVSADGLEGVVGTDVRYGLIVEEGYTGIIRPVHARALKLVFDGETVYRMFAKGQKGQHFAARTLEQETGAVLELATKEVEAALGGEGA